MGEVIQNFNTDQTTPIQQLELNQYANGAKHMYEVDSDGKRQHISYDRILAAWGYEARPASDRPESYQAQTSNSEGSALIGENTPLYDNPQPQLTRRQRLDTKRAEEFGAIGISAEAAKAQRRQDADDDKEYFGYNVEVGKGKHIAGIGEKDEIDAKQAETDMAKLDQVLEDFTVGDEMPDSTGAGEKAGADTASGWSKFFGSRMQKLGKGFKRAKAIVEQVYSEHYGVSLKTTDIVRIMASRHWNPQNLQIFVGHMPPNRDPIIDVPVLRDKYYEAAADGNKDALDYLRARDPNFGKRESTMSEALQIAAFEVTGYGALKRLGLYACAGAIAGKVLISGKANEQDVSRVEKWTNLLAEPSRVVRRGNAKRAVYNEVAESPAPDSSALKGL